MTTTYKFRAECLHDVQLARAILSPWTVAWQQEELFFDDGGSSGEYQATFTVQSITPAKDFLIWILSRASDLHVIEQTMETEADYTGERNRHLNLQYDPQLAMVHDAKWFRQYLVNNNPEVQEDVDDFLRQLN
jgi:hypothetical protein